MSFLKLDAGILDSSLNGEPLEVRWVFVTMGLKCDPAGYLYLTAPAIARYANVPLDATRKALEKLSAPDSDSRSSEEDGRRIRKVEGGWLLVNHAKYRAKDHTNAERQKKHRETVKALGKEAGYPVPGDSCPCCGRRFEEPFSRYVVLDHNHRTGERRDYLCQSCNKLVGQYENGRSVAQQALPVILMYLERHGGPANVVTSLLPSMSSGMSSVSVSEKGRGGPGEKGSRKAATRPQDAPASADAPTPAPPPSNGRARQPAHEPNPLIGDRTKANTRCHALLAEIVRREEGVTLHAAWRDAASYQGDDGKPHYPAKVESASDSRMMHILDRLEERAAKNRPVATADQSPRTPDDPQAKMLWRHIEKSLQPTMEAHTFMTWIRPAGARRFVDKALEVLVPNATFMTWLSDQYGPAIQAAAGRRVVYAVGEAYD